MRSNHSNQKLKKAILKITFQTRATQIHSYCVIQNRLSPISNVVIILTVLALTKNEKQMNKQNKLQSLLRLNVNRKM